mgnify:CR=1 FL=1
MRRRLLVLAALLVGATLSSGGEPHLDYAVDVDGALYAVDLENLTTRRLGHIRAGDDAPVLGDLVATPDGFLYGISTTSIYRIDLVDTTLSTKVGDHGLVNPYGVGLGNDGQVYAMTSDGRLFVIDPATARSHEVGALGGGFVASGDLAVMNDVVYASVKDPARREHLVTVDPATGAACTIALFTDVVTNAPISNVFGLVCSKGILYGLTSTGAIMRVNPTNGRCTILTNTGISWWGATEYLRL